MDHAVPIFCNFFVVVFTQHCLWESAVLVHAWSSISFVFTAGQYLFAHSPVNGHLDYFFCSFALRNTTAINTMKRAFGAPCWRNLIDFPSLSLVLLPLQNYKKESGTSSRFRLLSKQLTPSFYLLCKSAGRECMRYW